MKKVWFWYQDQTGQLHQMNREPTARDFETTFIEGYVPLEVAEEMKREFAWALNAVKNGGDPNAKKYAERLEKKWGLRVS